MSLAESRRQQRKPIPPGLRRVREVAALISVYPSTIYYWIRHGKLKAHEYGHVVYVDTESARSQRKHIKSGKKIIPDLPPPSMVSIAHASADTGVPTGTIQHWAAKGLITAQRHGTKLWYVDLDECLKLADTMKPGPAAKT